MDIVHPRVAGIVEGILARDADRESRLLPDGSGHYFSGAPAASQDASRRRSLLVISVMLPGGMACERTA